MPAMAVITMGTTVSHITVLRLKTPRNMVVVLISTIGPKVRKASNEPVLKVPTKASAGRLP